MQKYWLGVASHAHVKLGVAGGFAQLCHGKAAPLRRMKKGDWIIYYSSKKELGKPEPEQAFTAIGQLIDEQVYQFEMAPDFIPFRRNVRFLPQAQPTSIFPLIDALHCIPDKQHWGYNFRFGHLEIDQHDFLLIAVAMGLDMQNYSK